MLNAQQINVLTLNSPQPLLSSLFNPIERTEVYLLDIGIHRVPMSSFQATMRRQGKSFLQVIVPNGDESLSALQYGSMMRVQLGYYYPSNDEFDGLEVIAQVPLEIIRSDQGPTRNTLSLSGYGDVEQGASITRSLIGVSTRSINQGVRRVRCSVDLLLRPGDTAIDQDGSEFVVDQIQYFVNANSAAMEVTEGG
ncbi:hypothetical protein [Halomonas sp. TD01]|uniref:hypothetical protein n=1 Tax=Halomonas sp. TD01 TaxID=999141 RepID=UPI000214E5DA|nr:hypothetical protein [Halomonas sp. TD01]EGP18530.1 hypothetical protein GME_16362 [Halomonas sp. TD01]CAH1044574.1 hypothetical protein HPTD01_3052 [Halomonas sp. TD01]